MIPQHEDEYVYAGVKPCGCVEGFVPADLTYAEVGKVLSEYIANGCHIQRIPGRDLDIWQQNSQCRLARYAYASIKPCGCISGFIEDSPENRDRMLNTLQSYLSDGCHIERILLADVDRGPCRACRAAAIKLDITAPHSELYKELFQ